MGMFYEGGVWGTCFDGERIKKFMAHDPSTMEKGKPCSLYTSDLWENLYVAADTQSGIEF